MNSTYHIIRSTVLLIIIVGLLGWVLIRVLRRSEDPVRLVFKLIFTALVFVWLNWQIKPFAEPDPNLGHLIIGLTGALILLATWRHNIADIVAKPFGSLYDGGDMEVEPQPYYSISEAKRKQGKYTEAVAEIRKQLDKFPNDFNGQMMLAGIQAENLNDLPGAELTIHRLCAQRSHAPLNVAHALSTLADWHLKYELDREAARKDLQQIVDLFPETDLALVAAQRIAHLAGTDKLVASHDHHRPAVPEGIKNLGLLRSTAHLAPTESDPTNLADEFVKRLEQHPQDTEAREKLAVIYADHYGRLDLAADQLNQLIEQPNQPAKLVVHWLNLLADLQVRHGADYATVEQTLGQILDRYPHAPGADVARTRLSHLKLEFKTRQKTAGVKMGTYEQNIGLKAGTARPR